MLAFIPSKFSITIHNIWFISCAFQRLIVNSSCIRSTNIFTIIFFTNFETRSFIINHNTIKIFKLFTNCLGGRRFSTTGASTTPNTLISKFYSSLVWWLAFMINNSYISFCHVNVINFDSIEWFFSRSMLNS